MQGIALGCCCKSDGMIFYCPHNRQLYTSSDYKSDEGRNTPNTFNLHYDGGIFVGLYNHSTPTNLCEPFPEGTPVSFPIKSPHDGEHTIHMRGMVISVPISNSNAQLPMSDNDAPPYVVQLIDGSIHKVSPDFMLSIITEPSSESNKIRFPSWLGNSQKVMYLHEGIYKKGVMEWDLDKSLWRFSQHRLVVNSLVSIFLTFANHFSSTLMMALLFQVGMEGKTFISLVVLGMFLHLIYSLVFRLVRLLKLYIQETPTGKSGWTPTKRNTMVFFRTTLLTS
jgi:hypothetical protein